MSVRSNILALLTLSPAYGLQLHAEIETRTARVGRINVGQIYSTLTRLVDAGLATQVARSDGALPLYELTDAGRAEASAWLTSVCAAEPSWAEMVEQVLLVASLPGVQLSPLLEGYRALWAGVAARAESALVPLPVPAEGAGTMLGSVAVSASADRQLAEAALAWLDNVTALRAAGALPAAALRQTRPKRGRRPSSAS